MAVIREIVTDVLLAVAVLVVAASAAGVLAMRDAPARLHFVTPAAVVAPVLVAMAVFVRQGLDENTGETLVALFFMVLAGPYLSHAAIRAIRVREHGDWRLTRAEHHDTRHGEHAQRRDGREGRPS
jgi:multicomponent Na+:H+ antiporter subunit G